MVTLSTSKAKRLRAAFERAASFIQRHRGDRAFRTGLDVLLAKNELEVAIKSRNGKGKARA